VLVGYVVQVSVAWMDRRDLRQVQLSSVRLASGGRTL
jgi:hypothetical protein